MAEAGTAQVQEHDREHRHEYGKADDTHPNGYPRLPSSEEWPEEERQRPL
jgi:hypothetical protein